MIRWKKRTEAYEEVEYEPLTVLEILIEMKDISELMTSLAYGALILENDPIGEEVEELARRMDWLKYQLRLQASLGVRNKEAAEQVAGILQVADASEHIANAAAGMLDLLDANVDLRPFLGRVLDEADDRITTLKVPLGSVASGQKIGTLRMESVTGIRVLAIRRGTKWIYDPGPDIEMMEEDVLLVRGQQEGADHLRAWLKGEVGEL
jgi:uncharacterized protein with PhoU and TrkA domain